VKAILCGAPKLDCIRVAVIPVLLEQKWNTRNPCCRKETARCCNCSFQFNVRQRHSLCKFKSSQASNVKRQSSRHAGAKQNLTQNGDLMSSKVTRLESVERQCGNKWILYHNVGLNCQGFDNLAHKKDPHFSVDSKYSATCCRFIRYSGLHTHTAVAILP